VLTDCGLLPMVAVCQQASMARLSTARGNAPFRKPRAAVRVKVTRLMNEPYQT